MIQKHEPFPKLIGKSRNLPRNVYLAQNTSNILDCQDTNVSILEELDIRECLSTIIEENILGTLKEKIACST